MILVSTFEIGQRLDVNPGTVHQWRHRDLGFPPPLVTLRVGPIWDWPTVEAWAKETGRD